MSEWIDVNDRLPDYEVLMTNGVTHIIGYFDAVNSMGENEFEVLPCVTHWMPLPELPTTNQAKQHTTD